MKKIVVLRDLPEYKEAIENLAGQYEVIFTKNKEESAKVLLEAEIVLGWSSLVVDLLDNPDSKLRWVQLFTAGVDDMPLAKLKEKNIILTNANGVHPRQISETIFASMLAFARRVPDWINNMSKSHWDTTLENSSFDEIHGKTIGILGVGAIGIEVAKIARAFSMYTLGIRNSDKPTAYIEEMYPMDELKEMLGRCEYVVNLLPLTSKTRGFIDAEAFNAMPNGARYFNFGRGETTITEDLIEAIKSGKLSAVGLDVVDKEPLPKNSPLWKFENVLISPHISGVTPYYNKRVIDIFKENLKNYLIGLPLTRAVVDYDLEY